ncbi:mitochondrial import inner membrane translocase subunit Tim29 [Apis dorsata]|uniref:mitochondrial import inner membrane translocase subunit Tim29 n=1 Tax=Apis dorsata TaxID=7462 RepID=UPI0003DF5B0C|nr:mitochondrial import inner membrane translocase subunit Tim29 [Apis dorsata]
MNMNYNYFTQFQKYKFTLKLINPIYVLNKTKNLKIPEKLKGTFLERWGLYWKNLYIDYKESALGAAKDCKEHPIRTSIYFSLLASCVYLYRHNPDECTFKENLLQNTMKIMQVGEAIRNPISEHYVKWLGQCYNEGIIRRMNLGIISLIWLDDYDNMCSLYKTVCPYLKIQYLTFHKRVIDFGLLDKWWILENKMKDYDVNETEFSNVNK